MNIHTFLFQGKVQSVKVTAMMYQAGQLTHPEEKVVNLHRDLGQIETTEQLMQQIPCVKDMCQHLILKFKSSSGVYVVCVQTTEKYSLVCVLNLVIKGNSFDVEKHVMFPVHLHEWNNTTRFLCKMTKECYPVFGLSRWFMTAIVKKLYPQEILNSMRIRNISCHWILVEHEYLKEFFTIYDSQISLERYPKDILARSRFCACPQQPNDFSCGVHALMFLVFKKHGKPITINCLRNEDPFSILHDLISLLNGDNDMTTDTLIEKYYINESGRETYYTYDVKKEKFAPPSIEVSESAKQLEMLEDE